MVLYIGLPLLAGVIGYAAGPHIPVFEGSKLTQQIVTGVAAYIVLRMALR